MVKTSEEIIIYKTLGLITIFLFTLIGGKIHSLNSFFNQ